MSARTLWAHPPGTSALRARRQATKTPMTSMCREVPASRVSTPHQGARNVSEASWECQAASYAGRDDGARCVRSVCGECLHRVCWCLSLIGM